MLLLKINIIKYYIKKIYSVLTNVTETYETCLVFVFLILLGFMTRHDIRSQLHLIFLTLNMAFEIRKVGYEDYKNVMDIRSNVYGGFDYLPAIYHDVIGHPSFQGYAAVINDEFVSFIFLILLLNGILFPITSYTMLPFPIEEIPFPQ